MQEMLTGVIETYGNWGVFLLIAIENIFPPIPSEVILTFSGFLTTCTTLTVWGAIMFATAGSVVGAAVLYGAGRLLSAERLENFLQSKTGRALHLDPQDVHKAAAWFKRKGWPCVFYCRCIPIVRSLISIPAGMAGMRLVPFFLLTTAGSFVWNVLLVNFGALAGQSWPMVVQFLAHASDGVKLLLYLAVAIAAFVYFACKRRRDKV